MIDIFDIVKLYQEDITKVEYTRRVINVSRNVRINKINNNNQGKAIQKNLFVMRLKGNLDQINSVRKQNPDTAQWYKDYSIWYSQDKDKFIIHIGNINSGSEIRDITVQLVETENEKDFIDVFMNIDRELLRFDNFLIDYNRVNVSAYYYETQMILQILENLAVENIPTELEE